MVKVHELYFLATQIYCPIIANALVINEHAQWTEEMMCFILWSGPLW